jgi:hypothetical protein
MANKNCLEGMMCPECGAEEPFRLVVTTTVLMWDDGAEEDKMGGGEEWDPAFCECYACHHTGTVKAFLDTPTVTCKFCEQEVLAKTAHLHRGSYVGEICCWDERLRMSE